MAADVWAWNVFVAVMIGRLFVQAVMLNHKKNIKQNRKEAEAKFGDVTKQGTPFI